MKRLLPLLALLPLFAAPAAMAYDERALLKDYIGLTKVLASYGINASAVNWGEIEPLCLGLKSDSDPITYNECRLEKAINQVAYHSDTGACDAESQALYPSSLQRTSPELTIEHRGDDDKTDVTTVSEAPLYTTDLKAGRLYVFDRCMKDHGWRAAHDWRLGMDR